MNAVLFVSFPRVFLHVYSNFILLLFVIYYSTFSSYDIVVLSKYWQYSEDISLPNFVYGEKYTFKMTVKFLTWHQQNKIFFLANHDATSFQLFLGLDSRMRIHLNDLPTSMTKKMTDDFWFRYATELYRIALSGCT